MLAPLKSDSANFLRLDFVRFFASAGIIWHHSHLFLHPVIAREALAEQTAGLALFVDLFFVISGFIVTVVYGSRLKSISSTLRFLQRAWDGWCRSTG